jgi:hypothetical protein
MVTEDLFIVNLVNVKEVTMSNNNESSVEWLWLNLTDDLIGDLPPEKIHRIYELVQQAKAMEATSKQMSYGDGYSNGYDRALELVKWKINNELSINNK